MEKRKFREVCSRCSLREYFKGYGFLFLLARRSPLTPLKKEGESLEIYLLRGMIEEA
jgi:hypothetical protein